MPLSKTRKNLSPVLVRVLVPDQDHYTEITKQEIMIKSLNLMSFGAKNLIKITSAQIENSGTTIRIIIIEEDQITQIGRIGHSKIEMAEEGEAAFQIEEVTEEETTKITSIEMEIVGITMKEDNIKTKALTILREALHSSLRRTKMNRWKPRY